VAQADEITLADNIAAWRRWRLRPRVLVDVTSIDTSTTWLGQRVAFRLASHRWPSSTLRTRMPSWPRRMLRRRRAW
jgi:hypothetical protein